MSTCLTSLPPAAIAYSPISQGWVWGFPPTFFPPFSPLFSFNPLLGHLTQGQSQSLALLTVEGTTRGTPGRSFAAVPVLPFGTT